jgi:primosomal protein N' (replication factor Y) (superfamily II helicase)
LYLFNEIKFFQSLIVHKLLFFNIYYNINEYILANKAKKSTKLALHFIKMLAEKLFVEIVLPINIPNIYTYSVPEEFNSELAVGKRVVVSFGKQKLYSGLIRRIHNIEPKNYKVKPIDLILDEAPVVTELQFKLWEWMAFYYMANIGEVMIAALPGNLKLSSESNVIIHPKFDGTIDNLTNIEVKVLETIEIHNSISIEKIGKILERKSIQSIIKSMIDKEIILIEEEIKDLYKPRIETYIKLSNYAGKEENLKKIFDDITKAPKQLDLLMQFIRLNQRYSDSPKEVSKSSLQKYANVTAAVTLQLVKKGVFELYNKEKGRLLSDKEINGLKKLSESQQNAFNGIKERFTEKDTVLLFGVTSSGKTEIYAELIEEVISKGKQVLYLLPEIALTTQLTSRLKNYFGDKICVYHSRFSNNERVEIWKRLLKNEKDNYKIIVGARSSLFLPFSDIGLIIVDEEHETSYKQYNTSPRYNARDVAIYLGKLYNAKILLGSATPSIESYCNAKENKYGLVELSKRYGGVELPKIICSDIKEAITSKRMRSHFTEELLDNIRAAIEKKEQVILFQNRRGYSPHWSCKTCGWVPHCERCDVSTTYHKSQHFLLCHYCGNKYDPPKICQACGSNQLSMIGFGTEKIEEELPVFFPNIQVARMDIDSTRGKNSFQKLFSDFEEGAIDILVGTQMVTKGLDFQNVSLVGILDADGMLSHSDFRSNERAFQLMAQVAGRAGRNNKQGTVLIQTKQPNHHVIKFVMNNNYKGFFEKELLERETFKYPPYYRLIRITMRHRQIDYVNYASQEFANQLKAMFGNRILGPEFPPISRIKNMYHKNILVKIERTGGASIVKNSIKKLIDTFLADSNFKQMQFILDVDPF